MRDHDVNQIYLNKYLAEQEREDAYQQAVTDKIEEMCQRALTGDDLEEWLAQRHQQVRNHVYGHTARAYDEMA